MALQLAREDILREQDIQGARAGPEKLGRADSGCVYPYEGVSGTAQEGNRDG